MDRLAQASSGPAEDATHPAFAERIDSLEGFRQELERSVDAFNRGVFALQNGDAGEAVTYFDLFVAEFPQSLAGRVNLGAAHLAVIRLESGTPGGLAEALLNRPGFPGDRFS